MYKGGGVTVKEGLKERWQLEEPQGSVGCMQVEQMVLNSDKKEWGLNKQRAESPLPSLCRLLLFFLLITALAKTKKLKIIGPFS